MWEIRAIIRSFDTYTKGFTELVVEDCVSVALHELFGTVLVGSIMVTCAPPGGGRIYILPAIICVVMHCPDRHNEIVPDSPESAGLLVEHSISLALEKRLDHILVDMVTVSRSLSFVQPFDYF